MKILLTGGTGFIGSYILMKLLDNGHQVQVFARNPEKVPALHELKGVEFVKGEITDTHLFNDLAAGMDACIHVALNYNDAGAGAMLLADTLPAVALADACAAAGVKHFIYTSSTAVNDYLYMNVPGKGVVEKNVDEFNKQNPASYYGATKAATENFLHAISCQTAMRVNIVRPGYTFGNPVIAGASIYSDKRFGYIFHSAQTGRDIIVTKNDGTQFIWAGHLAEIFSKILEHGVNRAMYFGLAKRFMSWEAIAAAAIKQCRCTSKLIVEDKGWGEPLIWDVTAIKRDLGLEFDSWEKLQEHVAWGVQQKY